MLKVSIFHLMNHALFNALLFLSADSVVHSMSDEQDMRKLGVGGLPPVTPRIRERLEKGQVGNSQAKIRLWNSPRSLVVSHQDMLYSVLPTEA
ncbi:hypothetical protein R3W88_000694 [Solanum pinnatisectum]|uniref:NADH:quinone oxidoreductase/Mrp antiporter transmembrane domain-containing protein n=1 Tax=Solanum pinnatisectum TaxID=50273 RepID=A0AAV9MI47_9SOLN|nr:hypothetical protein R3W88_000694 [Solanum pinnatisectum]